MVRIAVLLAVAFFAGLSLGLLLGTDRRKEPALAEVAAPSTTPATPAAPATPVPGAQPVAEEAPVERPRAAPAAADLKSALAAILAAVPAPEEEKGEGEITGRVRTEEGEPVEGV